LGFLDEFNGQSWQHGMMQTLLEEKFWVKCIFLENHYLFQENKS